MPSISDVIRLCDIDSDRNAVLEIIQCLLFMSQVKSAYYLTFDINLAGIGLIKVDSDNAAALLWLDYFIERNYMSAILGKLALLSVYRISEVEIVPAGMLSREIFRLTEKASTQGDPLSSYILACLYFQGEYYLYPGLYVVPDAQKGMNALHKSLEQGHAEAALDLAAIYLGDKDINVLGLFGELSLLAGLQSFEKALTVLEIGCKTGTDKEEQSACALRLADLYRQDQRIVLPANVRKAKMHSYLERAMKNGCDSARAYMGALYLVGAPRCGVLPNFEKADEFFEKNNSKFGAYNNVLQISLLGNSYLACLRRYLMWNLRVIELSHYKRDSCIDNIAMLLSTGCTRVVGQSVRRIITDKKNEPLAERWERLSSNEWLVDGNDSADTDLKEYQQLVADTYSHFEMRPQSCQSPAKVALIPVSENVDENKQPVTIHKRSSSADFATSRKIICDDPYYDYLSGRVPSLVGSQ